MIVTRCIGWVSPFYSDGTIISETIYRKRVRRRGPSLRPGNGIGLLAGAEITSCRLIGDADQIIQRLCRAATANGVIGRLAGVGQGSGRAHDPECGCGVDDDDVEGRTGLTCQHGPNQGGALLRIVDANWVQCTRFDAKILRLHGSRAQTTVVDMCGVGDGRVGNFPQSIAAVNDEPARATQFGQRGSEHIAGFASASAERSRRRRSRASEGSSGHGAAHSTVPSPASTYG